jgi:hypothetical protein
VFEYVERTKKLAVAAGVVETMYGRRRFFNFQTGAFRGTSINWTLRPLDNMWKSTDVIPYAASRGALCCEDVLRNRVSTHL